MRKELAEKAGVGLRLVRDIEQGKTNLNMAGVNQVLALFGHELGPVNSREVERYEKS
ncbi:MAG: transcriptional regulator [Bacteroidetes bacterium]|nr:transcriptional regulator [Bacteroidota bacterium]